MPKKAKKGGGGKGGGRTERLEFLQQRAQAEEEMAKKREETLAQFLKDKLEKEEKNTAENLRKLNEGWRAILRQTRDPELRQEISIFSQTFERQLEGLDSVIKDLVCDLQEKERQSAHGRRAHLQRLEHLWALHEKWMMFVQQHWENGMQQLSSRFNSEGKQMSAHSQQQRADLEDAVLTVEQQHKEVMVEIHSLHSNCIGAYEKALKQRDGKETLKEESLQIQEALLFCCRKKEEVENLVTREQLYFHITAENMKEVKELQESVIQLREKLNSSQTENESKEQDLMASSNEVNKKNDELRQQLSQGRSAARKQLMHLTIQSNNAIRKLQAVIAKGEKVLRVAEMCRKLERKHEKVLTSSSSAAAENHRSVTEEEEPAKESSEFPELQQLRQRVNTALLLRHALKKQREDLSRQNQQLRLQLRQQVDDMNTSDRALDAHHALLTVSRAPTTALPLNTTSRRNITRAVHAVKHTASPKKI
ncbi:coiled-coil domain-containing protein 65 [Seriola lalandi dorsalis]|uniref:coiled-coil domain-containing protein 65 n=1 Tax=Seriola lalandi dorsalis TaxID=1841481 RepID=UPI000C6F507F|nr:coiled-coil domain-containing protein 65 [Seriola lalandi dorsalis]